MSGARQSSLPTYRSSSRRAGSLGPARIVMKELFPANLPDELSVCEQRQMNKELNCKKEVIPITVMEMIINNSFPRMEYKFTHMIRYYPGRMKTSQYWQIMSSMMRKAIKNKNMDIPFTLFIGFNHIYYAAYVRFSRSPERLDPRAVEFYVYSPEKEHSIPDEVWKFIESLHMCMMAAILGEFPKYCKKLNGKLYYLSAEILKETADEVLSKPVIRFEHESVPLNMRTIAPLWWLHQVLATGRPDFQKDMNIQCPRALSDLIGWYFTPGVVH